MSAERTILVVDNDADVRASLSRVLADGRTEVRAAETAEEALSLLAEWPPDLVISDIRMPGMDGFELLGLLRERAPEVDVVLMTAYDDLPTAASAMREGATEFLVKPLELAVLRAVVDRVFEDQRAVAAGSPAASSEKTTSEEDRLIGHHPRMVEVFKRVGQFAGSYRGTRTSPRP